ncbi:lipoyl synthase [Candidatus Magnetomonas plexicatena]|uniref:lipoyl synthase n=1 Tax=Candidatus Magnetomonas plexicatena TaxID=2552947 RepID=UPI001C73FD51|nr:lipoyl synthase [Nitrospirales bacterium LBB_01]
MKTERLPEWLKTNTFEDLRDTKVLLRKKRLRTVCEEARCPNKGYCFNKPTATFMILGDSCTRNCGFCSVSHTGAQPLDADEPERVAEAAFEMRLKHVVITSVTRDDLPDGGAAHFAKTVLAVRQRLPQSVIEVLTPDFKGDVGALKIVTDSAPDVFNHNVETVPSLYSIVRPEADYEMSLTVLRNARELLNGSRTKSGLMVGLGERFDEVIAVLKDLRAVGCNYVTIGQYLRPKKSNLPVVQYVHPDIFLKYKEEALLLGFEAVASAPLVRSSMDAFELNAKQQLPS